VCSQHTRLACQTNPSNPSISFFLDAARFEGLRAFDITTMCVRVFKSLPFTPLLCPQNRQRSNGEDTVLDKLKIKTSIARYTSEVGVAGQTQRSGHVGVFAAETSPRGMLSLILLRP